MATYGFCLKVVSVQDICDVASRATPHTFYRLDVSGPSVAEAVPETVTLESV